MDEAQGQGLRTIPCTSSPRRREQGVTRFVAWVQPDNEPMKALVLKMDPMAHARHEDGLLLYDFAVPGSLSLPSARTPVRTGRVEAS